MIHLRFYYDLYKHFIYYRISKKEREWTPDGKEIPKIIHYCWFGKNPETPLMLHCIDSWKKFLPEYKLQLWNEDNFPFSEYPFAAQAYAEKKWAFVSDVARLHALFYYGGIYMDTDVEILRSTNQFLSYGAFSGYESQYLISTGIIGAKKGHPWIRLLLSWYRNRNFNDFDKTTANTKIISKITALHCNVNLKGQFFTIPDLDLHIYSSEWFCPRNEITNNSVCIHHFAGSWRN